MTDLTPDDIIGFWYSDDVRKKWFNSTPEFDQIIRDRFEPLWQKATVGELDEWMETAQGCLALAIILDQFPLNMFRNKAKSFLTEAKAITVSKTAIGRGFDHKLPIDQLSFLYMPLMHSENLDDQDLSVKLFETARLDSNIRFARHHRELIRKFGRFPHRNTILGRESTAAEVEYLVSKHAFKG